MQIKQKYLTQTYPQVKYMILLWNSGPFIFTKIDVKMEL